MLSVNLVMRLCLVVFAEYSSKSALQVINTDFTFELFICAAILLENRESLLRCQDDVQLIQFTNRFVCRPRHKNRKKSLHTGIPVSMYFVFFGSLQGTLDLSSTLKKAEHHFYNYCKRCAWDYMTLRCRAHKSKDEDFLFQLRSLFVLK